jgi:NitT/TauT family transport system permease protein
MADAPARRRAMRPGGETIRRFAVAVLAHALVIAVWYVVVQYGRVPHYIMPTPLAALESLGSETNHWLANTAVTASEIVGGYVIAVLVGIALAIAFTWSRPVEAAVMPLLVSLNMIPKVALGPLFIVWFSYGVMPNTIIAFSISFFPILLTTARGFREVEPDLLDLVRSLRGSRWQVFSKIQLPGALPYIFSGMKVGAILAVAGAVVGEFLGSSSGLGYLMLQVQVTLDTASMFMAVILITLIGVVLYGVVLGLERLLVVRDARVE